MSSKTRIAKQANKDLKKKSIDPQEIKRIMAQDSKILEKISADVSPEKVRKITKDNKESISTIEKVSEILASDFPIKASDQTDNKEKVKKEMEKLQKELDS